MPKTPSDLLQELSKERKKKFSDTVLQEKLKLSTQQIAELEKGNLNFTVYPFNYYHAKTYVGLINPAYMNKLIPHHFEAKSQSGNSSLVGEDKNEIDFKKFFHKIKKYFHG